MDGLTCNRLAVLGKPSSMGGCRSGAAVPIGSHQRKESTTEAIGDRHYWVAEGYCPWFTHGYRRLAAQLQLFHSASPVSGYRLPVHAARPSKQRRLRVEWSGRFTPKGVSANETSGLFQGIFEDGLKALACRFVLKTRRAG